ncbi:MAG: S-type pyocin family protein [Alphaproteobacteria bacterium]|uniref:S-type pyocin family protein n=1 Tax=Brevundimonas sp. TaxID=1871086 RepID=UPI00180ECC79|nr:S-type pyocin family protein [Brevundimonas sp.]MBA3048362.1 S-type pyocin family protein [Brevundimonas sp.]MBU3975215.1 S-type pyocin family protein [Alphaproteobacteria bacterium]
MFANKGFVWIAAALLGFGPGLAGCGNGGSAVETRERAAEDAEAAPTATSGASAQAAGDAGAEVRPALTANRRETVDAKITRLFERNGADFGASTAEDYLDKVQAFTARPPTGTDRAERPNGDVLLYQASTNTFAVVSRDGVPKTMFKPRDGAAYWAEQKAAAPEFGRRRAAASDG